MIEKDGIVYESTREHLLKSLEELKKLQNEGVKVGSLSKEVWDNILELIHNEDSEKLAEVRERLKNL